MIEYFRVDSRHMLRKIEEERPGCWIAVFEPTEDDITWLGERFGIVEEDARAALDLEEFSRIEYDHMYTMFILDTPVRVKSARDHTNRSYQTIPIALFETPDHVITVCSVYKIPFIEHLKTAKDLVPTEDVKAFADDIIMASSSAYFAALRWINRRRTELAKVVQRPSRRDLEDLYALDSALVYFKTSLTTNDTMFEKHLRRSVFASAEERGRFDDVVISNHQALESTKIYSEILDSTIDHFSLLMEHDLNRTMQVVAAATLVLCIPTAVAGFFGMNVLGIPLADHPYGFGIVVLLTMLASLSVLYVLKKLRWF